jgi:hypothetical protein
MTPTSVRERAGIARQHLRVSDECLAQCAEGPSSEASVSAANAISAAIAASDAICGRALAERSSSGDHREAVALLSKVRGGAELSKRLGRLLSQKSQAQYGDYVTARVARDINTSARRVVEAMSAFGI